MSATLVRVGALLYEAGVGEFDATWQTTRTGKPHAFVVRTKRGVIRACTFRSLVRAVVRKYPAAVSVTCEQSVRNFPDKRT